MNNNLPQNRTKPGHNTQVDTGLIEKFLQNQSKELDIKAKEIEQLKTSDQHAFEYSKIALEKEAIDRSSQRDFVRKCRKDSFLFISGIVAVIGLLVGYSLWIGKDQIAMEIIKSVIFLLSGGAGGYAIGRRAKENDTKNDGE